MLRSLERSSKVLKNIFEIINDVVMHCNGKPVKFSRQENTDPNASTMGTPSGPGVLS